MGELVKLKNAVIEGAPEPDPNVIAYLEAQLAKAKTGELRSFAFVGVDHNLHGWNSNYIGDADARSEVVANVSYLAVQLALDAGELSEETEYGGGENGC